MAETLMYGESPLGIVGGSADSVMYDADTTVKQELDDKVSKSGDTMTGNLTVCKENSTTTTNDSYLNLGNNIPNGTTGSSRGIITLFDKNQYATTIYQDGTLTANRTVTLPDKNGTIALTGDLSDDVVAISDFTTTDGRFYTKTFTVIKRVRFPFLILRLRQGGVVPSDPIVFGSVDNQGSTLVMNFSDSNVTFNASTQTLTVDSGGSAWASPVIYVQRNYLK